MGRKGERALRVLGVLRHASVWPTGRPGRSLPRATSVPGSPSRGPVIRLILPSSRYRLTCAEDAVAQVTQASLVAGRRSSRAGLSGAGGRHWFPCPSAQQRARSPPPGPGSLGAPAGLGRDTCPRGCGFRVSAPVVSGQVPGEEAALIPCRGFQVQISPCSRNRLSSGFCF